ncbi:MAG: hypothetical protein R3229_12635 [Alphaproteobacteria bacterium]|nr:hypothetical protein [Alphaproteobacteria bacterium]
MAEDETTDGKTPSAASRDRDGAAKTSERGSGGSGDTQPAPRPGARRLWPWGILVVILIVLVLAWPAARERVAGWLPVGKPPADTAASGAAAMDALADRLARLEAALGRLGDDIAGVKARPPVAAPSPEIEKRLAALEARPEGDGDTGARITAMAERLETVAASVKALEARLAEAAQGRDSAATLALFALSGALRTGAPFAALIPPVKRHLAAAGAERGKAIAAGLDGLSEFAAGGVPTRWELTVRFAALDRPQAASPAPQAEPEARGFWDRVSARLKGLVKIRRVGGDGAAARSGDEGPLAAAADALAQGDLAAAIASLGGAEDAKAVSWREAAAARIKADALAATIDAAVAGRLGTAASAP